MLFSGGPSLSGGLLLSGGPFLSGITRKVRKLNYFRVAVTFRGPLLLKLHVQYQQSDLHVHVQ